MSEVEFKKFPSIERFANVMKNVNRNKQNVDYSNVTYKAKVKLHGTNAAIIFRWDGDDYSFHAQKRTSLVTLGKDNFGFAFWVAKKAKEFAEDESHSEKLKSMIKSPNGEPFTTYIFGEWVGQGVQKGVALSKIDGKVFCPFKFYQITDSEEVGEWFDCSDEQFVDKDVISIPIYKTYNVNLLNSESIQKFIDEVNEDVLIVEECDPFVKDNFGIEGVGEGLVLEVDGHPELTFKAKGDKHAGSKQSKPVVKDFTKATRIDEYLETHVTENRVRQGIEETGATELKNIPDVIRWVVKDVEKECLDNLGEGLEWEDVRKRIGNNAAKITKQILSNGWEIGK